MFESMAFLPWAINAEASRCAPVPQSKIRRSPLAVVISTQEVLPPKWFVPGPGVAIDPLVPQKRTFMSLRLPCARPRPTGNSIPPRGIDRQEIRSHHAASTDRKFDPTVRARPANCGGCAQIQALL